MPAAKASPTAFTTRRTTAAPSASASLTIPQPSPPIPSPPGGNAKGCVVGAGFPNCWFWRLRRQQQLHFLGLEDRNSGAGLQCLRLHRYHRSLSHRCLQMESHRASPVLRDFQKLGCRAPGQLRQNAQLHSHYQHPNRLGCDCLSGPKRVSDRSQTRPVSDLLAPSKTQQHTAEMELHHCTESVELLLRRP